MQNKNATLMGSRQLYDHLPYTRCSWQGQDNPPSGSKLLDGPDGSPLQCV